MIYGVQSKDINNWWSAAEPYITDALEYGVGEFTTEDIKSGCKATEMQLWVIIDDTIKGAFVTRLMNYPQYKVLLILVLAGGDGDKYKKEVDALLMAFAKDKGCKRLEFFGRKGWGKYLKDLNYKENAVMFTKEIV